MGAGGGHEVPGAGDDHLEGGSGADTRLRGGQEVTQTLLELLCCPAHWETGGELLLLNS